jgi:hypothetical protein
MGISDLSCDYKTYFLNKIKQAAQRYMEEVEKQGMNQETEQSTPIKLTFNFDSEKVFFSRCPACGGLLVRNFESVPSSSDAEKVPVFTEICCGSDCDYASYIANTMSRDGELIYNIINSSPRVNADGYKLKTIILNKFLKALS